MDVGGNASTLRAKPFVVSPPRPWGRLPAPAGLVLLVRGERSGRTLCPQRRPTADSCQGYPCCGMRVLRGATGCNPRPGLSRTGRPRGGPTLRHSISNGTGPTSCGGRPKRCFHPRLCGQHPIGAHSLSEGSGRNTNAQAETTTSHPPLCTMHKPTSSHGIASVTDHDA